MKYARFFDVDVPEMLPGLKVETQPLWGKMTSIEMLNHLCIGIELSLTNVEDDISTPEDQLPAFKRYLMSDKPFGKGLPMPSAFKRFSAMTGDIDQLKTKLMEELYKMQRYFEVNPGHYAIHQSFGRLNTEEWKQLHKKHITHHFTQFGLINP